jgi:hypothetical protein
MAIDYANVTGQTWVFPPAASTTNKSSSIWIGNMYELVGIQWPALAATTAVMKLEVCSVANSLDTADASCTFYAVVGSDGNAITLTATYTAAGRSFFSPSDVLLGPCRVRLAAYAADGTTAVNQDTKTVYPIFRTI